MKQVSLSGSPREGVGSTDAKALRNQDRVPCVLYGGEKQVHFHVDYNQMSKLVITPNVHRIALDIDGTSFDALIKEVQFHPVTDRIIHVDFIQLFNDKEVKIQLPLRVSGSAIGVRNGGRLFVLFRKLNVKGFPPQFPEAIELDITKLRIGQKIRVKDLNVGELALLHDPEAVVVSIKTARGAVDTGDEDEEEGGEGEAAAAEGAEAKPEAAAE
ncbi:MAG: 50S ribosomal protein L25/general stress protein Ctc [Cryomorphaceae bacterium]|nr:MAG: 50S ribosomal protein L25/general stress protein Ctc [Cryomorphaceae bacterium]